MSITVIKGKSHLVIKRNGTTEPYNHDKLYKVIKWACDGSPAFADQLINAVSIRIYDKISIVKLFNELIETAANLISDIAPKWETVAKNLYLLKIHKDMGVLRDFYPDYKSLTLANIDKGIYDADLFNFIYDTAVYRRLSDAIRPENDLLFTFGGLNVFVQKYCNHHKKQIVELPQHVYMRIAINLMHKQGVDAIIDKYNQLATHAVTEATPKTVNSGRKNAQMFSCCLARPEDSLESLNVVDDLLGRESKFGGGLSLDVSAIRAKGAVVDGNKGYSGGVIPFIQKTQAAVGAYNQGSTRSSACAVYYNWFHYQSPEITMLKSESGKDEDRARKLKYSIKWNSTLSDAICNDEPIYLIDPHKTQDMTYAWGDEWKDLYAKYSRNNHIHKRKYSARDLAYTVATQKAETGNIYTFFTDNANIQNIGAGTVTQSNLCCEYLPNFKAIEHLEDDLVTSTNYGTFMGRKYKGDIALCNLSSANLMHWVTLNITEKSKFMYTLVSSMDNAIDNAFYSNPLGKYHSEQHRNIGIGASNYANLLASNRFLWGSKGARKLTHEISEEISYFAIEASIKLASERGRCPVFNDTKWAEGIFPHELSILHNQDSELNYPLLMDWEYLRTQLLKYGIRNEYLLAIAPTATSSKAINATEGVDAPRKLKTIQEGTYSLPFVVPNLNQNREYYQTTFNIPNSDTIELAAIRQKFIDMGQSVSLAYAKPDSAYEIINDIIYAEKLGLKSLYYTHTPIDESDLEDEECDGCGA
jgi:ribonucleoside-diphosphate reductase alpha chain